MAAKYWHRLSHETALWQRGVNFVAGVDEAGCAPLAGPVTAAAVLFPRSWMETGLEKKLRGLNDSKQLDAEQRDKFFNVLTTHSEIRFAVATSSVEEIDRWNIRQAAWRAMQHALDQLQPKPEHALVDGLRIRWLPYPHTALVSGDCKSYSIAAASVLAKVTRDRIMIELDKQFPGYGFASHKGYPTPQHYAAIRELGACAIHRRSFSPFRLREIDLFPDGETSSSATTISCEAQLPDCPPVPALPASLPPARRAV